MKLSADESCRICVSVQMSDEYAREKAFSLDALAWAEMRVFFENVCIVISIGIFLLYLYL